MSSRSIRLARRLRQWVLPLATLLCSARALAAIGLDAPDNVAPLLRQYLTELSSVQNEVLADEIDRSALLRRLRRDAEDLLATEGYFTPQIELASEGGAWRLVVRPGVRSTIAAVDLRLRAALGLTADKRERRLKRLGERWPLKQGQPFRQSQWDAGKTGLVEDFSRHTYAAARIVDSLAEVDAQGARVDLRVELDPGPPFTIGELQVEGLKDYPADLVSRFNPPAPGEPFDEDRLLAFQTALQNTPYFRSVLVEVERDPALAEAVPLRVLVSEARSRRVTVGAGFSTNTGYRAEVGYRDANLFGRAWRLNTGLRLEQRSRLLFGDVFLPPAFAGHQDSLGALHEENDLEGLQISREAAGVTRSYPIAKGELSVSIKYQRERTTPDGALQSQQSALTGDLGLTWSAVNDVLQPRSGFVAQARLGGAGTALLADQNFVRAYGRVQAYFPVGARDVLTLRGELGKTFARSRDGIPQDFLFRAGGIQSVRGYAYRGLGVIEGDAVVGGRYLATTTAEYTHWRRDGWGVAGFVDAGNAADDLNGFRLLLGYGLGARWQSPAGPLALDLAYGQDDRRTRLHFSILIAF